MQSHKRGIKVKYKNLVKVIEINNIDYKELAEELNISVNDLEDKLTGKKEFILKDVNILLRLFPNVSYDYLFFVKSSDKVGL